MLPHPTLRMSFSRGLYNSDDNPFPQRVARVLGIVSHVTLLNCVM